MSVLNQLNAADGFDGCGLVRDVLFVSRTALTLLVLGLRVLSVMKAMADLNDGCVTVWLYRSID
jgi:hypothetical protein